jgi:KDO2-lipid IV(A) lauroyltransferase
MANIKTILGDIFLWFVWFPFRIFVRHLPIKLINLMGQLGGIALYVFSRKKREIMREELSFLFRHTSSLNKKEIKKMVYRGLQIFCKRQMENLCWGKMSPQLIERMITIEGITHLEKALQNKGGVILLTAHFGSHLLPPLMLGFRGYKVNQIASPPLIEKQTFIHSKIFRSRLKESERLPINFITLDRSKRHLFRALRNNEVLLIAFDGREGVNWIPVDFFNHKAFFSPGSIKLSLKTKAPILPTFIIRQKDDKHRLIIEPPFEFELTEDEEKTLALNTAKFAKKFEEYISKYPCHYAMTLMRSKELRQEGALKSNLFQGNKREVSVKNMLA